MEKDFNYQTVPSSFAHCFNAECPQSATCLRALAAQHCASGVCFISTVNPNFYPKAGETCPYFKPNQKVRMAWGISRLFDAIPYRRATEMRRMLIGHFNKSHYYRVYRKEAPLTPADQQYISRLFKRDGIMEDPVFDLYTEEYVW